MTAVAGAAPFQGPFEGALGWAGGFFGGKAGAVIGGGAGAVEEGAEGAAVGTIIGPEGTVAGGVVGAGIGGVTGAIAGHVVGKKIGSATGRGVGRWIDNKLGWGDQTACGGNCAMSKTSKKSGKESLVIHRAGLKERSRKQTSRAKTLPRDYSIRNTETEITRQGLLLNITSLKSLEIGASYE